MYIIAAMKATLSKTSQQTSPDKAETRKPRSDGIEARERLLYSALRLFAENGFAKTSTREIAQAAGVNIAAISYYFGDKAGLYRAVFTEPMGCASDDIASYDQAGLPLRQSLQAFFASFLEPMKQGDLVQLCTRLHFREMLEPTGLWTEEIDNGIKPAHTALIAVLSRHLGVSKTDDDIHRLAFSITGMALQMYICRDVIEAIRPQLIDTAPAIDLWTARLVDYAEAAIGAEQVRRSAPAGGAEPKSVKKKKS